MHNDKTDRRKNPRIRTADGVPVKISYTSDEDHVHRTGFRLTKDISLSGLRLESSYNVPPEKELHVQIALDKNARAIKQDARVCWSRSRPESSSFEIGIEFLDSDPRDSRLWERYIVEQNSSNS